MQSSQMAPSRKWVPAAQRCAGSCAATSRPARRVPPPSASGWWSAAGRRCARAARRAATRTRRSTDSAAGPGARMPSRAPAGGRPGRRRSGRARARRGRRHAAEPRPAPRPRSRRTARTRRRRCVRRAHACQCPPVSTSARLAWPTDGSDAASARDAAARGRTDATVTGASGAGRRNSSRSRRLRRAVGSQLRSRRPPARSEAGTCVMTRPSRRASSRSSRVALRCSSAASTKPHRAQSNPVDQTCQRRRVGDRQERRRVDDHHVVPVGQLAHQGGHGLGGE